MTSKTEADALFEQALQEAQAAPEQADADELFNQALAQEKADKAGRALIPRKEIDAIAQKYGADPQALWESSAYLGNTPESITADPAQSAREIAGFVGRTFALNVPQFIMKKMQEEPMRKALDEVQALAQERQPLADTLAETAGAVVGSVGLAKGAGKLAEKAGVKAAPALKEAYEAASAVGGAATQAAATSKEGEELEEAAKGAALGGVFYGAARAIGALLPPRVSSKAGDDAMQQVEARVAQQAEQETVEEAAERAFKLAELDERIAVRAADEVGTSRALEEALPDALANIRPDDVPEDSARLARLILKDDAGIRKLAVEAEERLQKLGLQETLDNLPKDPILRANTLAATEVTEDLKAAARFISDRYSAGKRFSGSAADAFKVLQDVAAVEGDDFVRNAIQRGRTLRRAEQIALSEAYAPIKQALQIEGEATTLGDFGKNFLDGRAVASGFDSKYGTNLTRAMDEFATMHNYMTQHVASLTPDLEQLIKRTNELGIEDQVLYAALDKGTDLPLPKDTEESLQPVANKLLQDWRKFFETIRQEANALGVNITKRDNYVPHKVLPMRDLIPRLQGAIDTVRKETGVDLTRYTQSQYEQIRNNETFRQLKESMEYLTGEKMTTPEAMRGAVLDAMSPSRAMSRLRSRASSALERVEDQVPPLIRESRVGELAARWLSNTFKHAYLREAVEDLRLTRDLLAEAGDKKASTYVHNLLIDVVGGTRQDTFKAAVERASIRWQVALDDVAKNSTDWLVQRGAKALAEMPEALQWMNSQVYPVVLGLNPRAVIQNLTQPLLMTVPELGYAYGGSRMLAATAQLASDLRNGKEVKVTSQQMANVFQRALGTPVQPGQVVKVPGTPQGIQLLLDSQGLLGRQWDKASQEIMRSGIEQGVVGSVPKQMLEKFNEASMFLYERAERMNRLTTSYLGEAVARDLMQPGSSAGAEEFLEGMQDSYRRAITRAREAGNAEAVQKLVTDYLVGKTIFNYSRSSMSAFGRYMGPLFSTFTKWPTSIAGDIMDTLQRQGWADGALDLGARYMAPLAALLAVERIVFDEERENPVYKTLIGSKGLPGWAPVGALASLGDGSLMQPPVVSAVSGALSSVAKGDPEAFVKWADNVARTYTPGAGLLRFLATDLQAIMGERPAERNLPAQIEKLAE
jgi:hypothetical protein